MAKAASVDHTSLSSSASHRRVQRSTTLNRKYVKKPVKVNISESAAQARTDDLKRRQALANKINSERIAALKAGKSLRPAATAAKATAAKATAAKAADAGAKASAGAARPLAVTLEKTAFPATTASSTATKKAKQAKDNAVESALKIVATMDKKSAKKADAKIPKLSSKRSLGVKKLLLAFGCAALAVGVLGYFISNNTPDISVRVAAMQTGIEATYPKYIPRGYSLSDIISGDKTVSMTFKDSEDHSFTLTEEATTWDNDTLEATYVKETWGNNYTSVRENGITIFISNSDAAWLNGNILYKIKASGFNLTKKQIKSIAANTSL